MTRPSTHCAVETTATRRLLSGIGAPCASSRVATRRSLAALLTLSVFAAGCNIDRLLEIETPSRVAEQNYLIPQNAALIVASSVADYECAFGGYVVASALAAGEFVDGSQTASRWSYDRRDVLPTDAHYSTFGCAAIGVYTPINTARFTNDQARTALAGWTDQEVPNRQRLIAVSSALAGYSLVLLGEGFCSAVINVGPELTSAQVFDSAVTRFTAAISAAQAANDQDLLNLAYVGRARALRDKGDLNGAAADAARVPVNFVYNATASTTAARRNNRVFAQNNAATAVTVAPAYRNMTIGGAPDPRVPTQDAGTKAGDQVNALWRQLKYGSLSAPIPIASGVEAQLILAEARGGAQGVLILNELRARAGLPLLTATEAANFSATLKEERNRWLWLQGNRWYDMRLGNIPQVPAAGAPYAKGGVYGDQRCWPLPDAERLANPNF